MSAISASTWPLGWIPSNSQQGEFGQVSRGLLRMDNLTLDEKGTLRLAKSSNIESNATFTQVNSIAGLYANSKKYRYLYQQNGNMLRNYNPSGANTLGDFDLTIFTGGTVGAKAAFLNALGHELMIVGSKKYKDDTTQQTILGIPAGNAPTVSANAAPSIDISNLNAGNYTNWTNVESSAFNNASTTLTFTTATATARGQVQTVFSSAKDTTNFGSGTGADTSFDVVSFQFTVDDPNNLYYVKLELLCEDPGAGPVTNYFWKEWDFPARNGGPYNPFNAIANTAVLVETLRGDFQRIGGTGTKGWDTIKAIRVTVSGNSGTTPAIVLSNFAVRGGATGELTGTFKYVSVEIQDNGQYVEFGLASTTPNTVDAFQTSIHVDRSGSAVSARANGIWTFRYSDKQGQYIVVNRQSGAYGFTPAAFDDKLSEDDAIASVALNPQYALEPYRTALPDNIIGMIWFQDRVVYLTTQGFIPSYKLDPGSYDARYVYEVAGSVAESCLFIAKVDVGIFIVATTRDFYRVTGDFTQQDIGGQTIQNITITALGVTDPAVSRSFIELEGNILYMSSSGIRSLNNGTSVLLNGNLDLLFRKEARYGIPAMNVQAADASVISCATSGSRIYWAIPGTDGKIRTFVNTLAPEGSYWRLLTESDINANPRCMFREDDGTIIFAAVGANNYVRSIEQSYATVPIYFQTPYEFGNDPDSRKEATSLILYTNTGGNVLNMIVTALLEDGSTVQRGYQFQSYKEELRYFDLKEHLAAAVAYSIQIFGNTNAFSLNYYILGYDARATMVMRKHLIAPMVDKPNGRRSLTSWPFRINPLGGMVTARVFADGTLVDDPSNLQAWSGNMPQTVSWYKKDAPLAYNWEIELVGTREFEFYEFLQPVFHQENPTLVKRVKIPYTAFDHPGRKCVASWPFRFNAPNGPIIGVIRADGFDVPNGSVGAGGADVISIAQCYNNQNICAYVWELEITSDYPFEFYEAFPPIITEKIPAPTTRAFQPYTDFGTAGRKNLAAWPFRLRVNSIQTANLTVNVKAGTTALPAQTLHATGDVVVDLEWLNVNPILDREWSIEVLTDIPMEFYEFLNPVVAQQCPVPVERVFLAPDNLKDPARKLIDTWPFRMNPLGANLTLNGSLDGVIKTTGIAGAADAISTLFWKNADHVAALDVGLEIVGDAPFEFYGFESPVIIQKMPPITYYQLLPYTNFGTPNLKKLSTIPFMVNPLGNTISLVCHADGQLLSPQTVTGSDIGTKYWHNLDDIAAVDWKLELFCGGGMEFYKFHNPEILQVYPMGKYYDQLGPFDIPQKGLIYGIRFRILAMGTDIHYRVYDANTLVVDDHITTEAGRDNVYAVKLPKGIDPSVCRVVLNSQAIYYRYKMEVHLRQTAEATEGKYIAIK